MRGSVDGAHCTTCPLRGRHPPVLAEGSMEIGMVIMGEAPGGEEVRQGRPFVGPSGRLLNQMLGRVGLRREDFWITNALLCRPPTALPTYLQQCVGKGLPSPVDCCSGRLWAELEGMRVVVAMGDVALQAVGGLKGITKWRGSVLEVQPPPEESMLHQVRLL